MKYQFVTAHQTRASPHPAVPDPGRQSERVLRVAPPTGQCSGGGQRAAGGTDAAAPSADEGAVWRDQVVAGAAGIGRGLWASSRRATAARAWP